MPSENSGAISEEFLTAMRETLAEGMRKIEHCAGQLTDEQMWWRPRPEMNSIANLCLHLAGNLRQWVIAGAGGKKDVRNRPLEFSDRSGRAKAEIVGLLKSTVAEGEGILSRLSGEQLLLARRIQGYDKTVLAAITDTVAHFRGHVQEIIHMTREQVGEKYRFDFVPKGKEQESAGGA
jgi:Protein of unknown function (DUF1572)